MYTEAKHTFILPCQMSNLTHSWQNLGRRRIGIGLAICNLSVLLSLYDITHREQS